LHMAQYIFLYNRWLTTPLTGQRLIEMSKIHHIHCQHLIEMLKTSNIICCREAEENI